MQHVIMKCPVNNSERRIMVGHLKIIKMKFDLTDILQRNSYNE